MKINEVIGIYHHMEELSPEVKRAQRMAELKNLSEYRAKVLQRYKDWADPVKRAEIQENAAMDLQEAKKILDENIAEDPFYHEKLAVRVYVPKPHFSIKLLPQPKLSLFQRVKWWLSDLIHRS